MASITDVISANQGEYLWGVRDCLITAQNVLNSQNKRFPDYSDWHALPEQRAIVKARQQYGSVSEAHSNLFRKEGLHIIAGDNIRPGDIVIMIGDIRCERLNLHWNTHDKCELLGFVTETYEVWTWFLHGLMPVLFSSRLIVR